MRAYLMGGIMWAGEEVIKNIEQRPAEQVMGTGGCKRAQMSHVAELLEESSLESWRSDGVTSWQLGERLLHGPSQHLPPGSRAVSALGHPKENRRFRKDCREHSGLAPIA
eukprot:753240-Hanusia_phi.AAC.2